MLVLVRDKLKQELAKAKHAGSEIEVIDDSEESFSEVKDAPDRTNILSHDVDVVDASPVKPSPYRMNPVKCDLVSKEIEYMVKHNLIQPSGYWQVPLSDRAREMSPFVSPFGRYECKVMPFWNKKAACTFQRLMNRPFNIAVDASDVSIGGVLFQRKEDSVHPVSYYSKKLLAAGKRYSIIEKEALSLVGALNYFKT
ncbi:uncharacterized protein [Palaemon carinicauda]|uniref:uncharacterized protein n=1 Tax=Palaemon carinicauda TaxID=392227 RepID=UPI0035B67664